MLTLLMMAVDEGRGDDNRAGGDPEALPRLLQHHVHSCEGLDREAGSRAQAEWGSIGPWF